MNLSPVSPSSLASRERILASGPTFRATRTAGIRRRGLKNAISNYFPTYLAGKSRAVQGSRRVLANGTEQRTRTGALSAALGAAEGGEAWSVLVAEAKCLKPLVLKRGFASCLWSRVVFSRLEPFPLFLHTRGRRTPAPASLGVCPA